MRAYSANGPNTSGSATKTGVSIIGGTTVRPRLYELIVGNQNTPADQAALHAVTRFTADGTGTGATILAIDPQDVAAIATSKITYTVEPTQAAQDLLQIPLNMRASFRWVSYQPGYELMAPATSGNGLAARLVSATTAGVYNYQVNWYE